jgi:hypothetical protein
MLRLLLTTLILALSTALTHAQDAPTPQDWGVHLAADPIHIEGVGLTIHVPVDSLTENSVYQKRATTTVQLPENLGAVVLQERRTKKIDLTTKEVADGIITQLLALTPWLDGQTNPETGEDEVAIVGTRAHVMSRDKAKKIDTYTADHTYVAIPREGTNEFTIRGSTLIKTGPGRFILIELFTSLSKLERAKEMYEVMLATIKIDDPTKSASRRAAEIAMGIRILDRLTESDYRQVFEQNAERWERLYRQSPSGSTSDDEEIGYRRIRAHIGQRGQLSPQKPKDLWTPTEQEQGYIVQIDARILDQASVIDTRATYFLSMDFSEEAWVVNLSIAEPADQFGTPGKKSRWQEIGARRGKDISIRIIPQSEAVTKIRPQIQGQGYISVVQSFLLPQLLVQVGIPGDMAFYAYQTTSGTIRLRTESLSQSDKGRKLWRLNTRLNADAEPQETIITAEGKVLRTTFSDGRRWETLPLDQLVRLWKRKGLPLD